MILRRVKHGHYVPGVVCKACWWCAPLGGRADHKPYGIECCPACGQLDTNRGGFSTVFRLESIRKTYSLRPWYLWWMGCYKWWWDRMPENKYPEMTGKGPASPEKSMDRKTVIGNASG